MCASRIFEFVLVCLFSHTNDLKITVHVLMVADFAHCRCSYVVCVVCQCVDVCRIEYRVRVFLVLEPNGNCPFARFKANTANNIC